MKKHIFGIKWIRTAYHLFQHTPSGFEDDACDPRYYFTALGCDIAVVVYHPHSYFFDYSTSQKGPVLNFEQYRRNQHPHDVLVCYRRQHISCQAATPRIHIVVQGFALLAGQYCLLQDL
jgi:hypothetical protein